eukprot:TRINITY_DN13023_c0_g1_i1.p1 TRINITY_DN13023_c0_g1~~TRINITY_DN13023_c0_g1_i1.p1  ORF type:complete len:713 (+),score=103.45 TRINITY_DN13023_c0_g1_i1:114-2252(+)
MDAGDGLDGVITRLFNEGQYTHILRQIFLYLDGTSLRCAELVCWSWRRFILEEIWENVECSKLVEKGWKKGIPATRRLELGTNCVSMVVDEKSIVCGLEDGRVDVYSRASMQRTHLLSGHSEKITSLHMDPRFIVTGCWDGTIRIWCRHSGNCLAAVTPHAAPVTSVFLDTPVDQKAGLVRQHIFSASRDGLVRRLGLVAGRDSEDGDGRKFSLVKEPLVEDYSLQCDSPVTAMTLGKNHILTGLNNAKVLLWDKRSQSKLKSLERHKNSIRSLCLRYPLAMSGSRDKTALLWDLEKGQAIRELKHSIDVRSVYLNNRVIITTDDYKDIYIWDLEAATPERYQRRKETCIRSLTGHNGPVHSLHCERGVLISCDTTGVVIEKDFWRCVEEGPGMRILRCSDGVNCMVCDMDQVVVGLLNKTIEVYDRATMLKVRTLVGHDDHVWSIDMNKEYIVSGSWDSSVRIWDRDEGRIMFLYTHPHGREISGVKISGKRILVTSLAGSLNVLKRVARGSFIVEKFFPGSMELGEIYSLACDTKHVITGHTLTNSAFKIWSADNFDVVKIIKEESNESIIWNIHLKYPLALICRDNECLDLYNLEAAECVKSLKHESKVLCATVHEGKIIVGCQYGLLVFWDLSTIMAVQKKVVGMNHSHMVVYEHSAAISNIHVDSQELITDDYDGVVILRNLRTYRRFGKLFRRATDPRKIFDESLR